MKLPQLEDLPLERGMRALVRVDFNVPLDGTRITDDLRITTALPTIEWLHQKGARIVLCAHLGRPKGQVNPNFSLEPVAIRLSELLGVPVPLAPATVGKEIQALVTNTEPGDVLMLENLRFNPGENTNDLEFAENLTSLGDVYVNEAFGASHRAHASIVGPPRILPSAAGRLLFREVEVLSHLLNGTTKPFLGIVGGAKVSDKLGVLSALVERCDTVLIGGAMSYTFLLSQGHSVGNSLVEPEFVDQCKELLATGKIRLPVDLRVAEDVSESAQSKIVSSDQIPDDWEGVDIGPGTIELFVKEVVNAQTILWNGPMGVFELPAFAVGTHAIAEAVAANTGFTVIGGGDSAAAIRQMGLADRVTHVSTGGGASLEFIENGDLPGLEALRDAAKRTAR